MGSTSFDCTNPRDDIEPWVPSVPEIEASREARGIPMRVMADVVGYSGAKGWSQAVNGNAMGTHRRLMAVYAFHYFDHHGIVPIVFVQ